MSSTKSGKKAVSTREQTSDEAWEFERVSVEFRASVSQEIQAKIDYADEREVADGRLFGQTQEAFERMCGRETEVERTRARTDRRQEPGREGATRYVTEVANEERREAFAARRASVDPWADPEIVDPRETLARDELAGVNREAARLHERYDDVSRAAIGRELGERVADGQSLVSAVVAVAERLRERPGRVVPVEELDVVDASEVCVEGVIERLWTPSHPAIQWVGLLEDETGRVKVTSWKRSNQPTVREGERVRIRAAAKNWYEGSVSLAVTGWSGVTFPGRGRYWK
jgi:hypothetical protein